MQVPIIAPIRPKKAEMLEQQPLKTNYSNEFLAGLMDNPELVRNVAVVGHLHHGKTLVGPGSKPKPKPYITSSKLLACCLLHAQPCCVAAQLTIHGCCVCGLSSFYRHRLQDLIFWTCT